MSEKMQRTAIGLQEKMFQRYGDELAHKHNKNHLTYRRHYKSHPCTAKAELDDEILSNGSSGLLREFKLRKLRKRLAKGRIH